MSTKRSLQRQEEDRRIGELLRKFRKQNRISQGEIADLLSIGQSTIVSYENGRVSIDKEYLEKLISHYRIDPNYFKNENIKSITQITDKTNVSGHYYPDVLVSAGLENAIENSDMIKMPVSIPHFGKDVLFVNVFGDSMYPKFCSGEIVGIKQVEKDYVIFGHAYVVVFTDGQAFIKYVCKGRDENHWTLKSENDKYEEQQFHIDKISKVFVVKGVITKLTM